ncbi:MAG: endonuclease/exonuclease/phosphatase family protein [Ignavibacteriaceae bacterium]|nr:endonuclease/exonuclease/phosphatase family protein [Ignavibacteriaceae bacterium]
MANRTKVTFTILFFYLTFFLTIAFAQNGERGNQFRVMTYNIRYAGDEKVDGINAWSKRKDLVASMISFNHAEIVGVQEALLPQLNDLTDLLDGYSWFGVGRNDGIDKGEFSAILFKVDRFKLFEQSTFWLSETPDVPSKGWDAAFPRIVTWGKLRDLKTQKDFYIFNTHYDHIGETARNNSSKLLMKRISEIAQGFPVIVMGDFNTQDSTLAYQIITNTESNSTILFDAQFTNKTTHHGSHISFNGFGQSIEPDNKIDFIFTTSDIEVLQHGVIDEMVDGRYPSDHMPVVAEVLFK